MQLELFDEQLLQKNTTKSSFTPTYARPQYKNAVMIHNHTYRDTSFSRHYALKKEILPLDEDKLVLHARIKKKFGS